MPAVKTLTAEQIVAAGSGNDDPAGVIRSLRKHSAHVAERESRFHFVRDRYGVTGVKIRL